MAQAATLPEGVTEEPIVREPLSRSKAPAAPPAKIPEGVTEHPIERAAPAAQQDAPTHPENYGFTAGNMLHNAKEGLSELGTGALAAGHDLLTNPDWVIGQGNTLKEKILDPNTSFNKIVGAPAAAEEGKAKDAWKQGHVAEAAGHELASYLPVVGPWAANLGEQAGTGDVGGAVAKGATQAVTAEALPKVAGKAINEVKAVPTVWKGLKTIGENAARAEAPPAAELPTVAAKAPAPKAAPLPEQTNAAPELPKPKSSMKGLMDAIEESAGTPKLKPDVPLGKQLFTPKLEGGLPSTSSAPKPDTGLPSAGQKVSDVLNQNTETEAVRPLSAGPQKNTPLKDITAPPEEPVTHRATVTHEGKTFGMEAANGKKMYDATAHDTELARDVHALSTKDATKGPTVQNAFMNAGGDVNTIGQEGQRFKAASKVNDRTQMFDWMLDQGLTPQKILELAKKPLK